MGDGQGHVAEGMWDTVVLSSKDIAYEVLIFYSDIQGYISALNFTSLESVSIGNLHAGHLLCEAHRAVCHASFRAPALGSPRCITCQPVLGLPAHLTDGL